VSIAIGALLILLVEHASYVTEITATQRF